MSETTPEVARPWTSDVVTVTGSIAIAAVLSLVYLAVAGRVLGPAEYSDFAAAVSLATLLAVALGALTPITSVLSARYVAAGQPARVRGLVATLLRIVLLGGAALLAVAVVAAEPIRDVLQLRSAAVVAAAVVVYIGLAASSVIRAALRGAQRFRDYGRGVVAEAVVRLALGVALLLLANVAVLAVLPYAAGTLIASVAGLRVLRRLDAGSQPVRLSEVTALLGPTVLLVAAMAVYQNIDVLLVKRFFPAAEAGYYGAAAGLARTMALLLMPFEALLLPRLTYLVQRREEPVSAIAQLTTMFLALAVIPIVAFAAMPRFIMSAVYGAAYEPAAPLLLPLAVAMLLLYLSYVGGQALISVGRRGPAVAFAVLVAVELAIVIAFHPTLEAVTLVLVCTRSLAFTILVVSMMRLRWR